MRTVALVLMCLACVGHARKAQNPLRAGDVVSSSPDKLAKLLVSLNPAAAFKPTGSAVRSHTAKAGSSNSRPVVSRSTVVTAQETVDPTKVETPEELAKRTEYFIPQFGYGLNVKAERWNGRHAMFGWLMFALTAYIKTHGGFPDGDKLLQYADWGSLTLSGFGGKITNERAIILVAHIHALAISVFAAFQPRWMITDPLFDDPNEEPEEPYGAFPPFAGQFGLTPAAEIYNGRIAMLGITAVVICSYVSGLEILEIIDIGTGGLFLSGKF